MHKFLVHSLFFSETSHLTYYLVYLKTMNKKLYQNSKVCTSLSAIPKLFILTIGPQFFDLCATQQMSQYKTTHGIERASQELFN